MKIGQMYRYAHDIHSQMCHTWISCINFSYHFYTNYIWISCENFFLSFWHEKYSRNPRRKFFVSFQHENILMWIWCENFLHQIHVIRIWYFKPIINFTWNNVEKSHTTWEKIFVLIWHENDMNIMQIFLHKLHALLDLLLNCAKIFARNSCQFKANFMCGTFCLCRKECHLGSFQGQIIQ